nr:ATP-binding cassette protein C13 [Homo sapiens]
MLSSTQNAGGSYQRVRGALDTQKCSPEKSASFFSKVTYSWFSRVITLGYKRPLEREDLFELKESDSFCTACPIFEKQWRKEVLRNQERQKVKVSCYKEAHIKKPSLLYALWNTFKSILIQVALFKVFADILSFTSPLIMKQIIIFCEHSSDFGWNGYGYAVALLVVVFLQTLILQQYQRFNMLTSAKVKTAVNGLIYKKVSLATLCVYFLLDEGNILTATKVFTSMSLFNILRIPLFELPTVISAVVQTKISLGRLEDFLNTEELLPQSIETNYTGDHAIGFTDASFSWDKTGMPVLKEALWLMFLSRPGFRIAFCKKTFSLAPS